MIALLPVAALLAAAPAAPVPAASATATPAPAAPATAQSGERRFMISGFDRLRVLGPYRVEVARGAPAVTASGGREALLGLSVRVEGGLLVISGNMGVPGRVKQAAAPIRIIVTTRELRSVLAQGGASVRVPGMRGARVDVALDGDGALDVGGVQADELAVVHTGKGLLTLTGTAGRARLRGSGEASLDAARLTANDAVLLWQSKGPASLSVRYTAQVSNDGTGAVTIVGKPECKLRGTGPTLCGPPKR